MKNNEILNSYHNLLIQNNKINHSNYMCKTLGVFADSSEKIVERLNILNKTFNNERKIDVVKFIQYLATIDYRFEFSESEVVENFIRNRLWKRWKLLNADKENFNKDNQFNFVLCCYGNAELNVENDYKNIYVNASEENFKLKTFTSDNKYLFTFIKTAIENNLLLDESTSIVHLSIHSEKEFARDYIYFNSLEDDKSIYYLLIRNSENLLTNLRNFFNGFWDIYYAETQKINSIDISLINNDIPEKEKFIDTLIKFILKCRFNLNIGIDISDIKEVLHFTKDWENIEVIKLCFVIIKIIKEILITLLMKMI